jgi:hypothetical protein
VLTVLRPGNLRRRTPAADTEAIAIRSAEHNTIIPSISPAAHFLITCPSLRRNKKGRIPPWTRPAHAQSPNHDERRP